jgi:hypothetical protein
MLPLWLIVPLVVAGVVAVTGVIAYLIDRLNHGEEEMGSISKSKSPDHQIAK